MRPAFRRSLWLVLVVLVVAGGISAYFYTQSRGAAPKYRTARVERGTLTAAVSATGNLNAVTTVQVGSQISGQIKELLADFNSVVKRGQLIARIDPETYESKLAQARSELDAAQAAVLNQQAQVEKARADVENARSVAAEAKAQTAKSQVALVDAKRDYDRKSELMRKELIAKSELDSAQALHDSAAAQLDSTKAKEQSLAAGIGSAQAQLRVAEAMLKSAQAVVEQRRASLRQAQLDLERTRITAPVDGVVVSRAVDVGQTVAASLQAPVLFTIAQDLTKMQVDTSVDEADIGRIKLEDRASFTVDAFPGETFTGTVTQIRKAALIVQNVVTYTVVVSVANPQGRLLPGMTANVKLVHAEKANVLKVPNAALRFRPAGEGAGLGGGGGAPGARAERAPGTEGGGEAGGSRGAGGGGGGGAGRLDAMRERLVTTYKLNEEQQAKLDAIFQEVRGQFGALQGLPEAERQARIAKNREATRAKIREILTPEQRARYDADTAAAGGGGGRGGGGRGTVPGRVYVQGPDGKPQAVQVMLGISDGAATEVVSGDLKEGQEIITGVTGAAGGPRQPTPPGGGGAGGPRLRL
ncbi:MAG TPA: efflux RND transporter periplasmic adaptor subunit [Terriglobales bacterium]|nr:efflux RND transporter periplasmic adaptor subunit [Terriglobales bacterium]